MLNLRQLVRAAINSVNPDQPVVILRSDGFEIVDYEQRPKWLPARVVMAQSQPVADKTLQLLIQQRQNTIWRDFYLDGDWNSLRRATESGGDLVYWDGFEWAVDQVLEAWSPTVGWTKIRCVQIRRCDPPEDGAIARPGSA